MRKKITIGLCLAFCLFGSACSFESTDNVVKNTPKPRTQATTSIDAANEQRKNQIVTDSTEIDAMATTIVEKLTLEQKVGQLFIANLEQLDQSEGEFAQQREYNTNMGETLRDYHIGGVILFSRNIESINQTTGLISSLQSNADIPLFVSVDEEGGDVARVGNNSNMRTTTFPPMEEVGKTKDESYVYQMGATIGRDIKSLGFNVDFAPVADVKTNEYNKEIGNRSFGSDAKKVAKFVKQAVIGIQDQNVSATLKHFPGHGSTTGDTHDTPVNVEDDLYTLRSREFLPFQAGIDAGADFVMVSHISISKVTENTVPASMSKLVIQNMLREELGFEGIVITDAMDMGAITKVYAPEKAAVKCIKAGADIVLMSTDVRKSYEAVLKAVKDGTISEEQLNASVDRIIRVKIKRGIILRNTDILK
ncbi:MAG: glycoside hydrolase family 3 protein [Lachnospiraceae bacterium]|nr:glycoside hydrolase family 3 protein [Lachnospiraceae bacterium]